jgi:hypothetical protein
MVAAGCSGDEPPHRNISGFRGLTTEEKVAAPLCVTYPCVVRLVVSTLLAYMNRWTARVLLLLLLMGEFGPVALAISASAPHACCMRKPMRHSGHESAFQSACQDHRCCTPLASTHWAQAGTVRRVHVSPPATVLNSGMPPVAAKRHVERSLSVRAPPQFSAA